MNINISRYTYVYIYIKLTQLYIYIYIHTHRHMHTYCHKPTNVEKAHDVSESIAGASRDAAFGVSRLSEVT